MIPFLSLLLSVCMLSVTVSLFCEAPSGILERLIIKSLLDKSLGMSELESIEEHSPSKPQEAEESQGAPLDEALLKKGLRTLGMHPLSLSHAYLELSLPNNSISDISVLKDYVNLMYIDLSNNFVSSLKVLENMPALVQLRARGNKLTECLDFRPPWCNHSHAWSSGKQAAGSMLTLVDLRENQISSMRDLSDHFFLEALLLGNNQIKTIKGLSKLRYLQTLDLSNNSLYAIEGLDYIPIRELNLSNNNLISVEGLSNLPCLSALNVSHNNITSLYPLSKCSNLTFIDASHNELTYIRQVEFLADIEWLQVFSMHDNPCFSKPHYRLRVIFRLPNLQKLDNISISYEEKIRAANLYKTMEGDLHLRERVFAQYCPTAIFMDYSPQQLEEDEETEVSLEALTYDPGFSFNPLPSDDGDNTSPKDLVLQDLGEVSALSLPGSIRGINREQ